MEEGYKQPSPNDWVISRVFQKTSGGKKVHISGLVRMNSDDENIPLPPLLDPSPYTKPVELELDLDLDLEPEPGHVHCFSNTIASAPAQKIQDDDFILPSSSNPLDSFPPPSAFSWDQLPPAQPEIGFQFPGPVPPLQDPSIIRTFLANYGHNTNQNQGFRKEGDIVSVSQETENSSVVSNVEMGKKAFDDQDIGAEDLDRIWSY
ncbi:hypothetical protein Salat_0038300 [Sesamum alatum]|uniref:Uncharacterized protein n=1 Tax=Sesamum alatum TaxID=300844 RepID=A0AAE2CWV5_9LAMI|nr:hypothetical protein Salat_0038300 [Sesamum alatum]